MFLFFMYDIVMVLGIMKLCTVSFDGLEFELL